MVFTEEIIEFGFQNLVKPHRRLQMVQLSYNNNYNL